MKKLLKKYGHIWVCGYILLYLPYFFWLESVITDNYKIMHVALDDVIPFSEYFIVPYMIWFFYVSGAVLYFFFTEAGSEASSGRNYAAGVGTFRRLEMLMMSANTPAAVTLAPAP